MIRTVILNVDELWLKGRNRKDYLKILARMIRAVIRARTPNAFLLKNNHQRLLLQMNDGVESALLDHFCLVPGLSTIIPCRESELNLETMAQVAVEEIQLASRFRPISSFKVETKRSNKLFPLTSTEVSQSVGGRIHDLMGTIQVDVHSPDITVDVRILDKAAYIAGQKLLGVGGLPVGTSGRAITLLSGGLDSPVASFLMAKRGLAQDLVFFHAYPFVGDEVKEKIIKLAQRLSWFQNGLRLAVIPIGQLQKEIAQVCKIEYRTLMFRVMMIQMANRLAKRFHHQALVVGDSLGQVSSQTLTNMSIVDSMSERIIFRPLIGQNKTEIMALAKKIGTFDLSSLPGDDACSLFAPQFPVTKGLINHVKGFFADFHCDHLAEEAFSRGELYQFDNIGRIVEKS